MLDSAPGEKIGCLGGEGSAIGGEADWLKKAGSWPVVGEPSRGVLDRLVLSGGKKVVLTGGTETVIQRDSKKEQDQGNS